MGTGRLVLRSIRPESDRKRHSEKLKRVQVTVRVRVGMNNNVRSEI